MGLTLRRHANESAVDTAHRAPPDVADLVAFLFEMAQSGSSWPSFDDLA